MFVPDAGVHGWIAVYRYAIRALTAIWGGYNDLLLPMPRADEVESSLLWRLLEVFDADSYHFLAPRLSDLRELDPPHVRADFESNFAEQARVNAENGIDAKVIEAMLWNSAALSIGVPDGFLSMIAERLGALTLEPGVVRLSPLNGEAHGLLTASENLSPLPSLVQVLDKMPNAELALLAAAATGDLDVDVLGRIENSGTRVERHTPDTEQDAWLVGVLNVAGNTLAHRVSNMALGPWVESRRSINQQPILCVGDDPWDFALAWSLRALGTRSVWVPTSVAGSSIASAVYASTVLDASRLSTDPIFVSSVSAPDAASLLIDALTNLAPELKLATEDPARLVPSTPIRLYSTNLRWSGQVLPSKQNITTNLETPLPDGVAADKNEISWVTDVRVSDWRPLRNPRLAHALVEYGPVGIAARCSRDGITYQSLAPIRYPSTPLQTQTVKPTIYLAELLEQVRLIVANHGWVVSPSDKGIYLRESAALFGGIAELVSVLSGQAAKVLELYGLRESARKAAGGYLIDGAIYFPLSKLILAMDDPSSATDEVFALVDAGALTRGLEIKCQRCRQAHVYRIDEIGEMFRCGRCGATQPSSTAALNLTARYPDPGWLYGLNEVLRQFLQNHGDIPLLGAWDHAIARGHLEPEICGELHFASTTGTSFETDIIMRVDGELWIGEASTADNLDKPNEKTRLERLSRLAGAVNARGVLLVTSADHWRTQTREAAEQQFRGTWAELCISEHARRVSASWK